MAQCATAILRVGVLAVYCPGSVILSNARRASGTKGLRPVIWVEGVPPTVVRVV